jgi:uncharacterized membrane protein
MSYQDPNQQNQYGGYVAPQPPPSGEQQQPPYGQPQAPYGQPQQPPYGQQQPPYGQQQPPYGQQQPPYGQQQPPYGQQQAPYGQQNGMGNSNDTSMGMAQNIAVLVSYALWWVTGLIVFFSEKKNRLVRFHAMQSILLFGGVSIVLFVLNQLWLIMPYGIDLLFYYLNDLVGLAAAILWLFLLFNAWQGRYFKLPIVGDYAERFTK